MAEEIDVHPIFQKVLERLHAKDAASAAELELHRKILEELRKQTAALEVLAEGELERRRRDAEAMG